MVSTYLVMSVCPKSSLGISSCCLDGRSVKPKGVPRYIRSFCVPKVAKSKAMQPFIWGKIWSIKVPFLFPAGLVMVTSVVYLLYPPKCVPCINIKDSSVSWRLIVFIDILRKYIRNQKKINVTHKFLHSEMTTAANILGHLSNLLFYICIYICICIQAKTYFYSKEPWFLS